MEGDKKRKRAASHPGRVQEGGHRNLDNSESTNQLAADGTPAVLSGSAGGKKTIRPGGRPRLHHSPLTTKGAHVVSVRKKGYARSLALADQVRHVVSVALDFPRILVSYSATSLIRVPDPQAISSSADPPATRAPAGAASTMPV